MTEAPAAITYASVVSRETVRIALTLAALNDLEVKVGDVMNAYITAPCSENIWNGFSLLGQESHRNQCYCADIWRLYSTLSQLWA